MVFYTLSLLGAFPYFPRTCVIWQLSMKSCVAYRLVSNFAIPTRHTHNITYIHTFRPPMLVRLQTHYIYEMYESKNTLLSMFVKLSQCFAKLQNLSNVKWLLQARIHTHITKKFDSNSCRPQTHQQVPPKMNINYIELPQFFPILQK